MRMPCLSALVLSVSTTLAGAEVISLANYSFNGAENHFNDPFKNNGTPAAFNATVATGLSATNPIPTGGGTINGVRLGNNKLTYAQVQGEVLLIGTTGSNAFSNNDYFSITLTPTVGYVLDFENITLQAARGGGSARGFRVRSSLDGFTANLNAAATETLATQRPTFTNYTIDLTAPMFNAINAPIEFRFYVYSSNVDFTVEMDNLSFNGTVAIPEPASLMGLLTLGGCFWMQRKANR